MMFPKQNTVSVCSVEGCNNAHLAKGLCNMHYLRMKISGSTNAPQRKLKDPREILLSRSVTTESGCVEWTGALREGYGRLVINKKYHSAHVLSWQLDHGEIPVGFQLNHRCHNRACINVEHLYLGTQLQNMADMRNAGREKRPKGRDFSTTKLTEVNVLAIRASEKSIASIAREYLVSESLIRAIKKREAWAWLGDVALARPKSNPVRSEEYRRLVASMSCKACGIQGYSQAAHVPPDGRGLKQDDRQIFALCCVRVGIPGCHQDYDQWRMFPREVAVTVGLAWAADTRRYIDAAGQWPKDLPKYQE